jgi:predicted acetyltransferase
VSLEVRPIVDSELVEWTAAMHLAFHTNRSAQEDADYQRQRRDSARDLDRTLAAIEDGRIVGTYESFAAELSLPGEGACVQANAITAVSVRPTHHRRGILTRMIRTDLEAARERGEVASVLIAAEYPIYGRFGFGMATQNATYELDTSAATFVRPAPGGTIELVEPERMRELAPLIFNQMRRSRPGQLDRDASRWDVRVGLRASPWNPNAIHTRRAVYSSPEGTPSGYALYRVEADWHHFVPNGRLELLELVALTPDAYLALWRFCAEIDLVSQISADLRPLDEPLQWLLLNTRRAFRQTQRSDFLWLRPLDIARLLAERRYVAEGEITLEVDDTMSMSGGRFTLQTSAEGARCKPSTRSADLRLGLSALGSLVLGGPHLDSLSTAGLVDELTPGSLARAAHLFAWPTSPWCSTFF